jgi:SAM-dependent methyltransferase
MDATYSPEDNKLRLYPVSRLGKETYERVKAAGFKWAPKQELFVAPMWTPEREDLLIELCGEIGDEDTSLVERAEERSERFEDYSDKRERDAYQAKATVDAIADAIPFGQPILVGHHSERHARKHKEQIESGMRKAVKMWETSQYWADRAAGAIRHAKYKELPDVRHRRIKGLESDLRKFRAAFTPCPKTKPIEQEDRDGVRKPYVWVGLGRGGYWVKQESLPEIEARYNRWIKHTENRLAYERAMLNEAGGIKADSFDLQVGGMILAHGLWLTIVKINKASGDVVSSVSTNNKRWPRVVSVEEIRGYREPTEEAVAATKAATKLAPLCNYPATAPVRDYRTNDGPKMVDAGEITQAEWDRCHKDYKTTKTIEGTAEFGRHRVRYMQRKGCLMPVYITDAKRKDPPKPDATVPVKVADLPKEPDLDYAERESARIAATKEKYAERAESEFAQIKDVLKSGGVKTVVAKNLFPTPSEIAKQVIELAEIQPGMKVLEPSAGTGNLLRAMGPLGNFEVVACEINPDLADELCRTWVSCLGVVCGDFIERFSLTDPIDDVGTVKPAMVQFDRVVMNPPFDRGLDIKHVEHALKLLKPGGKLVSIVANGPRQRAAFEPIATAWIDLPAGSFKDQGTNVNTAIVVIDKPDEKPEELPKPIPTPSAAQKTRKPRAKKTPPVVACPVCTSSAEKAKRFTVAEFMNNMLAFLTAGCEHYEKTAPTVRDHLDDVYMRLINKGNAVSWYELVRVLQLRDEQSLEWEHPNYAANRIYKLRHELGMDITGNAGF